MTTSTNAKPPVNWPTTLFILTTTLAACGWPLYAWHYGVTWTQVVAAVAGYWAAGLSITVGYHRLISHRTFKCHPVAKALLLIFGAAAWQGSAKEWAADHALHHAHIDTDLDPYNRRRGFWYAHMGWLIRKQEVPTAEVPDYLTEDRLVMLQDRFYVPLALTTSFILPWAIAGTGGLLLAGAVRVVVLHHTTWFINSWAHTGTRRPYNANVTAVDNWLLALVTFGEGWHNFHHAFPADYRNGVGTWAWDPSKWTIWLMARMGAAWDLRRVSPAMIWRRRVDTALAFEGAADRRQVMVARTREALERAAARSEQRLEQLRRRLADLQMPEFQLPEMPEMPEMPSRPDLAAWRERAAQARRRMQAAGQEKRLAMLARFEEHCARLAAYQRLLERLSMA
jgi:stearoyl-CoA desaturase (delta-9 desaturase)